MPVLYKQSTLSLLFPLGNLSPVPKCPLGVLVGSGCIFSPSVFIDFNHWGLLEAHMADSMNPLFCFIFDILFSCSFLSKIFYLWVLEDANEHSLWSAKVYAWLWCRGDRNMAGALVSFSAYKFKKIYRWLSVMELQNLFTVCQLTHVLRLCVFSKFDLAGDELGFRHLSVRPGQSAQSLDTTSSCTRGTNGWMTAGSAQTGISRSFKLWTIYCIPGYRIFTFLVLGATLILLVMVRSTFW